MRTLYICGTGIKQISHMTLETIETLKKCDAVFLDAGPSVEMAADLNGLGIVTRKLRDNASSGHSTVRVDLEEIFSEMAAGKTVGIIFQGNPLLLNVTGRELIRLCGLKQIDYRLMPAISSIDTVFNQLRFDLLENGVQIFDAVALKTSRVDPKTPLLLMRIAGVAGGFKEMQKIPAPLQKWRAWLRRLSRLYAVDHPVFVVDSAARNDEAGSIRELTFKQLMDGPGSWGATMFIPSKDSNSPKGRAVN